MNFSNLKLLQQGAEAKIFLNEKDNLIIKDRISKSYRIPELDKKIIKQRTKAEKKLLEKASKIINSPNPLPLKEINIIRMPFIEGKKLSDTLNDFSLEKQKQIMKKIGESVSKLHKADIIHGDLTTSNMILVGDKSSKMNNFNRLILELKKLNLPNNEYAVFGSGPLAIRGIRESKDIDIIVKLKLWNMLAKKYPIKNKKISIGSIDITYEKLSPWSGNINNLIDNAEVIDGIRFLTLSDTIKWKKAYGREKDKRDIQLIEKYQFDKDFQIFLIDFGLGYISKKVEDKAVDLHLLKQALEAKHFAHWKELFEEFQKVYSKDYTESKQIFERIIAVEKRGRYRH